MTAGLDTPRTSPTAGSPTSDEQAGVTRRYDRMAWLYDIYDAPMEWMGGRGRRSRLLKRASGRVLEVGIGTGANLAHYPAGTAIVGIDASEAMLSRSADRARKHEQAVDLRQADVTRLPFADDSFDTSVSTCVFCSVADPVAGMREMGRVTKPEGRILLLEHVRPRNRLLGWLSDLLTPITRRVFGFRVNRRTEDNVRAAGLRIVDIRRDGVWREIVASTLEGAGSAPVRPQPHETQPTTRIDAMRLAPVETGKEGDRR